MRTKISLLLTTALFLFISSCVKEGVDIEYNYYDKEEYEEMTKVLDLPEFPLGYVNKFPSYYLSPDFSFDKDLATLGRVIFYDKALSSDGTISCASCHEQAAAFADNKQFSDGVEGRVTARNSLALGSVFSFQEYYGSLISNRVPFFWDNRASNVEDQSRETFANEREMNMKMHEVVSAVNNQPYYRPLMKKATRGRTETADENTVLQAISIFVNSISSFNSKYDDALAKYYDKHGNLDNIENVDLELLSEIENRGKDIYVAECASCHGVTNGVPEEFMANNGLDLNYEDDGMGDGVFKVPTLRNITLTAPYMHDGRFATIDEVLDHYSKTATVDGEVGIKKHNHLSSILKDSNGDPRSVDLSGTKREDLKAFLNTFLDDYVLTAEKYSDPFIK